MLVLFPRLKDPQLRVGLRAGNSLFLLKPISVKLKLAAGAIFVETGEGIVGIFRTAQLA